MAGFGLATGVAFPPFMVVIGVPARSALRPVVFGATIAAGALVAGINFAIAHSVVGGRLRTLGARLRAVNAMVEQAAFSDAVACDPDTCSVDVDSEDEFGDTAAAFNGLIAALHRSQTVERAVKELSATLARSLSVSELAQQALNRLMAYAGADAGAFLSVDDRAQILVTASTGLRDPAALAGSALVKRGLGAERPLTVSVPQELTVDAALVGFRPRQVVAVPVAFDGVPLGVVLLAGSNPLPPDFLQVLNLVRESLGVALNNARIHERFQHLAAVDALTSLYNRRFGMLRLEEEWARSVRGTTPLGLLMFDIDHFKMLNDNFGHLAGDKVLQAVAAAGRSVLRAGDVIMRYGGEEFLAVLPGAGPADLRLIGERILRAVAEPQEVEGHTITVTVSVGAASYPNLHARNTQDLLRQADEALYRSKEQGRNAITLADAGVESAAAHPPALSCADAP